MHECLQYVWELSCWMYSFILCVCFPPCQLSVCHSRVAPKPRQLDLCVCFPCWQLTVCDRRVAPKLRQLDLSICFPRWQLSVCHRTPAPELGQLELIALDYLTTGANYLSLCCALCIMQDTGNTVLSKPSSCYMNGIKS